MATGLRLVLPCPTAESRDPLRRMLHHWLAGQAGLAARVAHRPGTQMRDLARLRRQPARPSWQQHAGHAPPRLPRTPGTPCRRAVSLARCMVFNKEAAAQSMRPGNSHLSAQPLPHSYAFAAGRIAMADQ